MDLMRSISVWNKRIVVYRPALTGDSTISTCYTTEQKNHRRRLEKGTK